jgi:hypothetical protein
VGDLTVVAWNCDKVLHGARELDLSNLLAATDADVAALSEVEIPATSALFTVDGYASFYPLTKENEKTRVLFLVKTELAARANVRIESSLMSNEFPSVWIRMDEHVVRGAGRVHQHGALLLGAVYRQWHRHAHDLEKIELEILNGQIERASEMSKRIILAGDFNLDINRENNPKYRCRTLLGNLRMAVDRAGLVYHETPTTWRSYGLFTSSSDPATATPSGLRGLTMSATPTGLRGLTKSATPSGLRGLTTSATPTGLRGLTKSATPSGLRGLTTSATPTGLRGHTTPTPAAAPGYRCRTSTIDHVYTTGVRAIVKVLDDYTSDHRPLVVNISAGGTERDTRVSVIRRRNFNKLNRETLEAALNDECDFSEIHSIQDGSVALEFLTAAINRALDRVAPLTEVKVRKGKSLYLANDTLGLMKERDAAAVASNSRVKNARYRKLRNRCSVLVERDKRSSNESKLAKSGGDPRILWELASAALGKSRPSLPAALNNAGGSMTDGALAAAEAMNTFFVEKVVKLRVPLIGAPAAPRNSWPPKSSPFSFKYCNAGKIKKIVKGLRSTPAVGVDGIPVAVLKLGIECLASPISHVINRSLATGKVPDGFKQGIVKPVFKGGGKNRNEPSSYRPVCILTALSKVLEVTVKSDLCAHLAKNDAIPTTQHGFRPGRSCATALGSSHAGWLQGLKAGKIVGLLGFDLSAAFDTLHPDTLLQKLEAVGITGRSNSWFRSYLTGGSQCVDWEGAISSFVDVEFGVRQGSILGPILFILHTADMASAVGTALNVTYADDSNVWAVSDTLEELKNKLENLAARFSAWAKGNGLAMNAGKTQLLVSSNGGRDLSSFSVNVDGKLIKASDTFELLGVKYDRRLTTAPHDAMVAKASRQRASMIARLGRHLPRGRYLRQLASGLVLGKISHALPAVAVPRLTAADGAANESYRAAQVALNDVARTITGTSRRAHVPIADLLEAAKIPSINNLVTASVAVEAWKAYRSCDGENGTRNPIGSHVFDGTRESKTTRATTSGKVQIPLRGHKTMVTAAALIWNESEALRTATTLNEAKKVAKLLSRGVPL